jgi:hypothetical protein
MPFVYQISRQPLPTAPPTNTPRQYLVNGAGFGAGPWALDPRAKPDKPGPFACQKKDTPPYLLEAFKPQTVVIPKTRPSHDNTTLLFSPNQLTPSMYKQDNSSSSCNKTNPLSPDQLNPSTLQRLRDGISKLLTAVAQIFGNAPKKNNEQENHTEKAERGEDVGIKGNQGPSYIKLEDSPFCPSCALKTTQVPMARTRTGTGTLNFFIPKKKNEVQLEEIEGLEKALDEYMEKFKLSEVYKRDKIQALIKVFQKLHLPKPSDESLAFFLNFCPNSLSLYIQQRKAAKILETKVPELVHRTHGPTVTKNFSPLIILKWLIVGSLIDDRLDHTTPNESENFNTAFYEALSNGKLTQDFSSLPHDIQAYVKALQDLHCDLKKVAVHYDTDFNVLFKEFLDQVQAQHKSTVSEAEIRTKSIDNLTLRAFMDNRKNSLGFDEMLKLDMALKGLTHKDIEALNAKSNYKELIKEANTNIALVNEIVSYEKEALDSLGDDADKMTFNSKYNELPDNIKEKLPQNGILIYMKDNKVTLGDAIQYFLDQHEITAKKVEELSEELLNDHSLNNNERNHVKTVQNWVSGHVEWCYNTGRYKNKKFKEQQTKINSKELNAAALRRLDGLIKTITGTGI